MAETRKFAVTGMTCDHCEAAVRGELAEVIGIEDVAVSVKTGALTVTVADDVEIPDKTIIGAVDEAGYNSERVL